MRAIEFREPEYLSVSTSFFRFCTALLLLTATAAVTRAETSACDGCVAVGEWQLGVSIGLGMRSNPLVDGDDVPLVIIPSVAYYGERFFIENLDIGFTVLDRPDHQLNALLTPGYDRLYFERWDIRNIFTDPSFDSLGSSIAGSEAGPESKPETGSGNDVDFESGVGDSLDPGDESLISGRQGEPVSLDDRKLAALGGIEYSRWWGPHTLQLQVLHDVSGVHNGMEVRGAWQWQQSRGDQAVNLTLGFAWKDSKLMDYYYGVAAHEAGLGREEYNAGSGMNPFVRVGWQRRLSPKWTLRANLQWDELSQAMTDSPLLEQDYSVAAFVGVKYQIW